MKIVCIWLAIAATCVANAQYSDTTNSESGSGHSTAGLACQPGYGCVIPELCINGKIDVYGTNILSVRSSFGTCDLPKVCCLEPADDYDDYSDGGSTDSKPVDTSVPDNSGIEPVVDKDTSGRGENPDRLVTVCPNPDDDCVISEICVNGQIDTTGSQVFNPRSGTGTCYNADFPEKTSVCCRKPGLCPEHQVCLPRNQCGADGYEALGSTTEFLQDGTECDTTEGDIGVCCTSGDFTTLLPPAAQCGSKNYDITEEASQILPSGHGKNEAAFAEFPWQAIIFLTNFTYVCGAVLVSNRHVLTAAHCVDYLKPEEIQVRLGEWEVNRFQEVFPYEDVPVKSIRVHEKYKPDGSQRNNIAILELYDPINFKFHINTVCLPPPGHVFKGYCVATGWGRDSFYGDFQNILNKVEIPIVERRKCRNLLRKTELGRYFRLHRSFICAGGEDGIDTCTGDGGGPLVCKEPGSQQYYLAGLVNAGIKCGQIGVPALYTNIPYMSDWINAAINEHYTKEDLNGYSQA